ncbi:MAG: hypothetical protein ACRDKE_09275 [Solirubrobacterales bacterium]
MGRLVAAPLGAALTQGSVIDQLPWPVVVATEDPPLGIVLTGACDLQWEKASFVLIAGLLEARPIIQGTIEFQERIASADAQNFISKNKWKSVHNWTKVWVHNEGVLRYFTIDADVLALPTMCVDFQMLLTMPVGQAREREIIAELPTPDREKMIVHFSSYLCRIGVDRPGDVETATLINGVCDPFKEAQ